MRRCVEQASLTLLAAFYLLVVLGGRTGDLRSVPSTGGPAHTVRASSPIPSNPRVPYLKLRRHLPLTHRVEIPPATSADAPSPPHIEKVFLRTTCGRVPAFAASALPHFPSRAPPAP